MSNFANMSKHFNLGAGRVLFAHKKGTVYKIMIYEMGSDNRYVDFSIARWASHSSVLSTRHRTLFTRSIPTRS